MATAGRGTGSAYVADVLQGGEAEGGQGVRQGLSDARGAPALGGEEGQGQCQHRQHLRGSGPEGEGGTPTGLTCSEQADRGFPSLNHDPEGRTGLQSSCLRSTPEGSRLPAGLFRGTQGLASPSEREMSCFCSEFFYRVGAIRTSRGAQAASLTPGSPAL